MWPDATGPTPEGAVLGDPDGTLNEFLTYANESKEHLRVS
jgi:hypothetical protein